MRGIHAMAIVVIIAIVGAVAGGFGLYRLGTRHGVQMSAAAATPATTAALTAAAQRPGDVGGPATGKRVLYWHDPMVPGQRFDKPGKSPFMDMQLVPVYADGDADTGSISISPRIQQSLGVRTAEVRRGAMETAVEAVGSVAYNERDVAVVQARSNGFVERLYARAPLDAVRKGQPLAELYVPDWIAAQEEYLAARRITLRSTAADLDTLVDAARQRMRLAGMTDDQIQRVESSGSAQPLITVTAPISGVIAELNVREGMTVISGAPLFRINGLGTIWVNAEVGEMLAAQVHPGSVVEARSAAFPGTSFKGRVSAILPEVNAATRTLKARVEIANPKGQLVPGMFVAVNFASATRSDMLLVPTEAIIQTGRRNVAFVARGGGRFTPVDVEIGAESNGLTEVRQGLRAGQQVVVSGQFLIDSEASLKGTASRMGAGEPAETAKGVSSTHRGRGKVEAIDKDEITLSHDQIASLQWPAMTMGFKLPSGDLAKGLSIGDTVAFEIRPTTDGGFEIASISRSEGRGDAASGQRATTPSSTAR